MIWAETMTVVETLHQIMPDKLNFLRANAENYRKELQALDVYSKQVLASVPRKVQF